MIGACPESLAFAVSQDPPPARKNTRKLQTERTALRCVSMGAAGRALKRQRFKGERVDKSGRIVPYGNLGGTADQKDSDSS